VTPDLHWDRALVCVCVCVLVGGPSKFGTEMLGPFFIKIFLGYQRVLS
jgi:hypothetical protein